MSVAGSIRSARLLVCPKPHLLMLFQKAVAFCAKTGRWRDSCEASQTTNPNTNIYERVLRTMTPILGTVVFPFVCAIGDCSEVCCLGGCRRESAGWGRRRLEPRLRAVCGAAGVCGFPISEDADLRSHRSAINDLPPVTGGRLVKRSETELFTVVWCCSIW